MGTVSPIGSLEVSDLATGPLAAYYRERREATRNRHLLTLALRVGASLLVVAFTGGALVGTAAAVAGGPADSSWQRP